MSHRRRLTVLVLAAAACGIVAATASADPTGSKNSLTVPATCNGATVDIVVNNANGQGSGSQENNTAPFAPAHVIGSNEVFHPTVFDLTFSFTPSGGTTETFQDTNAMSNPRTPVACTIHFSQTDPDGNTFAIDGNVWGFMT